MPNGCVIKNISIRFFSDIYFLKVNKVNYGRLELMLKEQYLLCLIITNKSRLSLCAWHCVTYLLIYCLQETCEVGVVSPVLQVK